MSGNKDIRNEMENDLYRSSHFTNTCKFCSDPEVDEEIHNIFKIDCCRKCRFKELKFVTKTTCKSEYLLTEEELKQFPYMEKPNPHKGAWNEMHLYLKEEIEDFAIKKHGSLDKIETLKDEIKAKRREKQLNKVKKNIKKTKRSTVSIKPTFTKKHKHNFKQVGNKGICECGMEIDMETI